MGLLNLGIPDPRQWKKQQVSSAIVDKERGLTYITKKFNNIGFCMVKLHEYQARFKEKKATSISPIDATNRTLNDLQPLEGKKLAKRAEKLKESSDNFPLRLLLITQEHMDGTFVDNIKVQGTAKIMKVAGKNNEHFIDQLVVRKNQRGQGFGRLLFQMIQQYMQEVYQTDLLSTAATPESEGFFLRMEFKKIQEPVAFIDVQESKLLGKVNGMLGLAKDAMKRKDDDVKLWMAKEVIDMKLIGTPEFRRREIAKVEEKKKQEDFFESRKAKSTYEAVEVNKDLKMRSSDFKDLKQKVQKVHQVPTLNVDV